MPPVISCPDSAMRAIASSAPADRNTQLQSIFHVAMLTTRRWSQTRALVCKHVRVYILARWLVRRETLVAPVDRPLHPPDATLSMLINLLPDFLAVLQSS